MRFHEKLVRRVRELDIPMSKAVRSVGLPTTSISSYMAKPKSIPRGDIALKIARAIRVPLDWLVDEKQDWPPPENAKSFPPDLSDRELMIEISRRFRIDFVAVLDALDQVKTENWAEIRKTLELIWKEGDPMPLEAQRLRPLFDALDSATVMQLRYSPGYFGMANHNLLPGKDRPLADFDPARYDERFRELDGNKDFLAVYARMRRATGGTQPRFHGPDAFKDGSRWAESSSPPASPTPPDQAASPPPAPPATSKPKTSRRHAPKSKPPKPPYADSDQPTKSRRWLNKIGSVTTK